MVLDFDDWNKMANIFVSTIEKLTDLVLNCLVEIQNTKKGPVFKWYHQSNDCYQSSTREVKSWYLVIHYLDLHDT